MQWIKKWLRKGEKVLQQLVRRYAECLTNITESSVKKETKNICPTAEHCRSPLIDDCQSPQYAKVIINGFLIVTSKLGDRCFGSELRIIFLYNFIVIISYFQFVVLCDIIFKDIHWLII